MSFYPNRTVSLQDKFVDVAAVAREMTPPHSPYQVALKIMSPTAQHLDMPTKLAVGDNGRSTSLSRELPMPILTSITSLGQAHATLEHCLNRLVTFTQQEQKQQSKTPEARTTQTTIIVSARHYSYLPWLERWEKAFATYLAAAMTTMKQDDVMRSRVLKANHLLCTVLASITSLEPSAWDRFDSEFEAIVELSGAVLRSKRKTSTPTRDTAFVNASAPKVGLGMGVSEPLYTVIARCNNAKIRSQAIDLLSSYPVHESLWQSAERPPADTWNLKIPPTGGHSTQTSPISPSFGSFSMDAAHLRRLDTGSNVSSPIVSSKQATHERFPTQSTTWAGQASSIQQTTVAKHSPPRFAQQYTQPSIRVNVRSMAQT